MTIDRSTAAPRGRIGLPRQGRRPRLIPGVAWSRLTARERDKATADDGPRGREPRIGRQDGLGFPRQLVLEVDEIVIARWPLGDAGWHDTIMALIVRTARAYNPRTTTKGGRAMPKYLSQEWLDDVTKMAQGQPDRPGASARMQYVVTGGPEGDIKYYWVLENGKLLENKIGEISDADFTLTLTYDDSVKVQKGELDANAAFMQGRMKVTGNMGKLMQLMPLTNSPEYKQLQEEIRGITEY
jgi:SCP-2 sterol transfer family